MHATMQTQFSFNPIQTRTNTPFGGASSQSSRPSAFDTGRNLASQMSNMMGGFSKASYSISGQSTSNGRSTAFYAQGTINNRGQAANPMQAGFGHNGNQGCSGPSRGGYPASQVPPARQMQQGGCNQSGRADQTQWSDTPVSNNKASIDLGDYKLDFSKANSSMLLTDKKTGDTTNIYGDPHLEQHANSAGKTSAMFNGPMTFQLPDSTKITVGTQSAANNPSVSYANNVTITKGNQAYQVTGLSQQDKTGLSVQKSNNGRALDAATPDGYTVVAKRDGSGFIDPTTGKEPTANDLKKAA